MDRHKQFRFTIQLTIRNLPIDESPTNDSQTQLTDGHLDNSDPNLQSKNLQVRTYNTIGNIWVMSVECWLTICQLTVRINHIQLQLRLRLTDGPTEILTIPTYNTIIDLRFTANNYGWPYRIDKFRLQPTDGQTIAIYNTIGNSQITFWRIPECWFTIYNWTVYGQGLTTQLLCSKWWVVSQGWMVTVTLDGQTDRRLD